VKAKRIAILETRLGQQLVDLVRQRGGVPVHAPALAELPDLDPQKIAALVRSLEAAPAKLAIFQTGVGTRALFDTADALGLTARLATLLDKAVVVVRGPKPTGALRSRGVRVDLAAKDPFTTAEVLAALAQTPVAGERAVVQRYGVTNVELEEALIARGARVIEIPTYRWSLPQDTRPLVALMDALERSSVHAVAVTNAAQVHNLFELAHRLGRTDALRASLNRTLVASIGPVSTDTLKKLGVSVAVEASPPKLGPLVAALERALAR
jgi:uroporphyrinogen-III synthase